MQNRHHDPQYDTNLGRLSINKDTLDPSAFFAIISEICRRSLAVDRQRVITSAQNFVMFKSEDIKEPMKLIFSAVMLAFLSGCGKIGPLKKPEGGTYTYPHTMPRSDHIYDKDHLDSDE